MGPSKDDGRRVRSRHTRARIVEAGRRLFVAHGYLATTMEALADGAGVSVQTVYYVFGTKQSVLAAVFEATVAGDDEPVPVVERSWVDEVQAAADAACAVALLVEGSVAIVSRTAAIYEVVQNASTDAEVGALLAETKRRRRADQHHLVDLLADAGHLRRDLSVEEAADTFYAIVNEEVYLLLTRDCGWDRARFGRWATSLMLQQLTGT